jgi:hypothetical protein
LGAWSYVYEFGMTVDTARKRAGVHAMKAELIYNGYIYGIRLEVDAFGNYARDRTRDFQKVQGIEMDGVIGPITARRLFRKRVREQEVLRGIPDHLLGCQGTLESNNDPVAEGTVDPDDEGWGQIHLPFHPEVTEAEAWDPSVSIPWTAKELADAAVYTKDWDGGVAAYNIGWPYARQWVAAGKPSSGGPIMGNDKNGNPIDSFARATLYVKLVRGASW